MKTRFIACAVLGAALAHASYAAADTLTVSPKTVHPGDPVLVTVTGAKAMPRGAANGSRLQFFAAKAGYQAVFAVPHDAKLEPIAIEVDSVPQQEIVLVNDKTLPETSVIVEDEMANPDKTDRAKIDADNVAILRAVAKAKGEPQFTSAFQRPRGEVTSVFGEWRTFNDGHRSKHLGLDLFAKEGSMVKAVNAGTVVLVRECFLAGNVVVVSHGGGIASAYYHLSKTMVKEGEAVGAGDELGLAGHTGRTTGPHLHLSVHVPGGMVDPAGFFKLKLLPSPAKVSQR